MFSLKSTAFPSDGGIPRRYTGEGANISPELAWEDVPDGTQELAMICDDPDAPQKEPWVHWLVYKIPPFLTELPDDAAHKGFGRELREGVNSWGNVGYSGPLPPPGHGTHHYNFQLYALDRTLPLEPGATKEELLAAMKGHVLAETRLTGTYARM
jgi:Raf kinase inhibitor-like YbhB/YbcL family protein